MLLFQILLDFDRKLEFYVSQENSRFKDIKVGNRLIDNWAVEAPKIVNHAKNILKESEGSRSSKPCIKSNTIQNGKVNTVPNENVNTENIELINDEVKRSNTQYSNLKDILTKNDHLQNNG